MNDTGLVGAVERMTLACTALTAAAADLAVVKRHGERPRAGTVDELNAEVERVCELARELARRVGTLATLAGARE